MRKGIVKIPDYIGKINFDELDAASETIILTGNSSDVRNLSKSEYKFQLSKLIESIIDEIIGQLKLKSSVKKKVYKGGNVTWTLKKYECYLAIYLKDCSLSYTVRLNTINCQSENQVMYFCFDHMSFYEETLLYKILQDFTKLISECANVAYAFEGAYTDTPPRGTHRDGSWFCSIHEDIIMKDMHYYDGYIDYDNGRKPVNYNFDLWLEENKSI